MTNILITLVLFLVSCSSVLAQDEINIGGKAVCRLKGKVPIKKLVADGNRILLIEEDGVTKGSFILQLLKSTKKALIDFNTLALFGEVSDVDGFLGGKKFNFTDNDSDLMLNVTILKSGDTLNLNNELPDEKGSVTGTMKIRRFENNLANGNLKFVFQGTTLDITRGERNIEDTDKNSKVVLRCNFKDVPVDVK